MKERNITLLRAKIPSNPTDVYSESFEEIKLAESLATGYLEAFFLQAEDGWNVQTVNPVVENLSPNQVVEKAVGHLPAIMGISLTYQWQLPFAQEVAKLAKMQSPDLHIVVGGMFATSAWDQLLTIPHFDSVCRFEGENTLLDLARKLTAEQDWRGTYGLAYRDDFGLPQFPRLRRRITDLGSLPFPTRAYLPEILANEGVIQIEASRACNAQCTFCDVRMTGWVPRPVEHFVDEMELLAHQFPGHQFWIVDNIFIGFGKERFERAKRFAEEIKRRGLQVQFTFQDRAENMTKEVLLPLKQAGLNKVYLGIESFAQSFLDRIQKRTSVETNIQALLTLKNLGIFTQMGYLIFDEGTTMAEIKESLEGLRTVTQNNGYLHIHNFNELIPYAGTYLERRYEEKYGHKPDLTSDQIWKFPESEVRIYRDLAWQYLIRIWPVTEIIFHNFDNPQVYGDLPKFLPVKNLLLVNFFEYMHQAVLRYDRASELQQLCDDWVDHSKTTLSVAIEQWHHEPTHTDLVDAVARIT